MDEWGFVEIDVGRIKIIIMNIKSKAIKFGLPIIGSLLLVFGLNKIGWSENKSGISDGMEDVESMGTESIDNVKKLAQPIQELLNDMVFVSGGTFKMGCTSEQRGCYDSEKPAHSVTLSGFKIAKYEVTQEQWRTVVGSDPPKLGFKGCDPCPVESVNWNDTQDFIKKLNSLTGKRFRLPSEAEWEYAARGGKSNNYYQYAGSNTLDNVGWYGKNSDYQTHLVGQKRPNELGLYDMNGNVWEWCSDRYDKDYYSNSPINNPKGGSSGLSRRVLRGGSWLYDARFCRVAGRNADNSDTRSKNNGFRLAL